MERFLINNLVNVDSFLLFFLAVVRPLQPIYNAICSTPFNSHSGFLSFVHFSIWILVSTISICTRQNNRYEYHDTLTILLRTTSIYLFMLLHIEPCHYKGIFEFSTYINIRSHWNIHTYICRTQTHKMKNKKFFYAIVYIQ